MIYINLHLYFVFIYKVGSQSLKDFACYLRNFNYEYNGEMPKDFKQWSDNSGALMESGLEEVKNESRETKSSR